MKKVFTVFSIVLTLSLSIFAVSVGIFTLGHPESSQIRINIPDEMAILQVGSDCTIFFSNNLDEIGEKVSEGPCTPSISPYRAMDYSSNGEVGSLFLSKNFFLRSGDLKFSLFVDPRYAIAFGVIGVFILLEFIRAYFNDIKDFFKKIWKKLKKEKQE